MMPVNNNRWLITSSSYSTHCNIDQLKLTHFLGKDTEVVTEPLSVYEDTARLCYSPN